MTNTDLGFGRIEGGEIIIDFTKGIPKFHKLADTAHKIAKEKGFWDEPRTIQHCLAMVGTEIVEYAESRQYKGYGEKAPDMSTGIFKGEIQGVYDLMLDTPSGEAVDILIRILDLFGRYEIDDYHTCDAFSNDAQGLSLNPDPWTVAVNLFSAIKQSSKESDHSEFISRSIYVRAVIGYAKHWCTATRREDDLKALIVAKLLYNTTRPYKHGKTA